MAARADTGCRRRLIKLWRNGGAQHGGLLAPRVRSADRGVGGGGGGAEEVHQVQAEGVLQQGVPGEGMEGRAQTGVRGAAGGRRGRGREAVLQEAVRAALLGITRRALTERQVRGGGASAGGGFTTAGATALMVALTETASAQGGQAGLAALAQRMMTGLLGTNGRAPTHRQMRVLSEMMGAFHARKYEEVVRMEEEGLAVAGEIRGARAGPSIAAAIFWL